MGSTSSKKRKLMEYFRELNECLHNIKAQLNVIHLTAKPDKKHIIAALASVDEIITLSNAEIVRIKTEN